VFYRIASCLLALFAIAHVTGFRQTDPQWGWISLVASMRTIRFDIQGFSRTYWDFFVGAGLFVGGFLLFAAVLAWQLGGLSQPTLRLMPVVTWARIPTELNSIPEGSRTPFRTKGEHHRSEATLAY
jgi:hypothetical protein